MNSSWHDKHRLARNSSLEQRVAWHVAHAEACGCRPMPGSVRAELARKKKTEAAAPRDANYEKVVKALAKERGVTYGGKGFGGTALKVGGKIFAMLSSKGEFVVKLPKARVDELVANDTGSYFDPGRGRLMKEWLAVSAGPKRWPALAKEALAFGRRASE